MSTQFTDEQLMAFADGALDEPEFSAIAAAIEADPDVALRIEALAEGGRLAAAVYAPLADQPVPAGLRAGVEAAIAHSEGRIPSVVPLRRASVPTPWMHFAAAACLGALLAGPLGYFISSAPAPGIAVGQPLRGDLRVLVGSLPSGDMATLATGEVLRPIGTFTDDAGRLCREFELDGALATVAIACRNANEWRVALALATPATAEGYAPASSLAALDAYLASVAAGPNLSLAEEATALADR